MDDHSYMLVKKGTIIKTQQYDKNWKIEATLIYKNNQIWEGKEEGFQTTDIYKDGQHTQRIEYFSPEKKIIKSRKTYGDKSAQTIQPLKPMYSLSGLLIRISPYLKMLSQHS